MAVFLSSCASGPETNAAGIQEARQALRQGDLDTALRELNGILKDSGSKFDAETLGLKAILDEAVGNATKALTDLEDAIKSNPDNPHLYATRGTILAHQRNLDDAIRDFTRAFDISGDISFRTPLAVSLILAGKHEEAKKAIREMREENPQNTDSVLPELRLIAETRGNEAASTYAVEIAKKADSGVYGDTSEYLSNGAKLLSGTKDMRDIVSESGTADYGLIVQDYTVSRPQGSTDGMTVFIRPLKSEGISAEESAMITSIVRDRAVNGKKAVLVDAESRESALTELDAGFSGITGAEQDGKIGTFLACTHTVSGITTRIEGRRYCNLVLVETASGKIASSTFIDWDTPGQARLALDRAVSAIGL